MNESSKPNQQPSHLEKLARKALKQWEQFATSASDCELTLIKHRENAVFKAVDATGTCFALRLHRLGYHSDQALLSELQWMTALKCDGLRVPSVIPCQNGSLFARVCTPDIPEPLQCDLISWVDGTPLGSIETGIKGDEAALIKTYYTIGTMAAALHNKSNAWQQGPEFTRQAWDEDGLFGDDPIWGRFWELEQLCESQKKLLLEAREIAKQQLMDFGKGADRYGLIHCDFLPENILNSDLGLYLIDFDDSGFGWHMFEFATSLFFHLGEPHFDAVCDAMVAGYRSARDLSNEQLAMLPTFLLIRSLVYLGWGHTRRETETAQMMTPLVIEAAMGLAKEFTKNSKHS